MKRQTGILMILGALAALGLCGPPAVSAQQRQGGALDFGFFLNEDRGGTAPRTELYDFLSPSNATLGLNYWAIGESGRRDEITIVNPGDQDHEISFISESGRLLLEAGEHRTFHTLAPQWNTRREKDYFSLKDMRTGGYRTALSFEGTRRSGNREAQLPAGQQDRAANLTVMTPGGSVSGFLSLDAARMTNGADNSRNSSVDAALSYKPGMPLSAVLSLSSADLTSRIGAPRVSTDSVSADMSLRMSDRTTIFANMQINDLDSSSAGALSVDDMLLGLGINGRAGSGAWKVEYRFVDRSMSGIQTTGQEISRLEASVRLRPSKAPGSPRIRAGVRFETRSVDSGLQPSLEAFSELGSEKAEVWFNTSFQALTRGGSLALFAKARNTDFTLAPGIDRGTTGVDSFNYGFTANYPMGKSTLTYTYYYGKTETKFRMESLTAAGAAAADANAANDQNTHTLGLSWDLDSATSVFITALAGTGRSGGLFQAGRARERDVTAELRKQLSRACTGSLTLRFNSYKDDLTPANTDDTVYFGASISRGF